MHHTLEEIYSNLDSLRSILGRTIPNDEPFAIAHGNWSFPSLTRSELIERVQRIMEIISDNPIDVIGIFESRLNDYIRRIQFLGSNTIPQIWGSAAGAVPAFLITLDGLESTLQDALKSDERAEATKTLKRLRREIVSMEARFNELHPRSLNLEESLRRIEGAADAADQLPVDMQYLIETRGRIEKAEREVAKSQATIDNSILEIEAERTSLKASASEAKAVLERSQQAFAAATSVGLAKAFSDRSNALSKTMWVWVGGLFCALLAGGLLGYLRLQSLAEILRDPQTSSAHLSINLVLSIFSVGAPIWFAWLATKQIGQRFRLSEDYAFKASISQAYEGYSREAARVDKTLEATLLASALARLDELPLRLVETTSHGSPLHELASSPIVQQALNIAPNFAADVKQMAKEAIQGVTHAVAGSKTASKPVVAKDEDK